MISPGKLCSTEGGEPHTVTVFFSRVESNIVVRGLPNAELGDGEENEAQ